MGGLLLVGGLGSILGSLFANVPTPTSQSFDNLGRKSNSERYSDKDEQALMNGIRQGKLSPYA